MSGCDDSSVPTRCPAAANLTDGPTLGTDITGNAHDDMGDLEFDPTDATPQCPYLLSTDGGVYRSDDCAPTWERAMVGLHDTWLYDLAGAALAGNQTGLYYGQMDSGGWYSTDGGSTWGGPTCCDIWDVVADADRVVFTQCCPTTTLSQAPADDPSNISPMTPPPSGWLQWFQETDSIQAFATDSYVFVTQTKGNALFEVANGNGPGGIWITRTSARTTRSSVRRSTPANACAVEVAVSGGTPTFYVLTDDNLNALDAGGCSGGGHLFKYTGTDANGTWTPPTRASPPSASSASIRTTRTGSTPPTSTGRGREWSSPRRRRELGSGHEARRADDRRRRVPLPEHTSGRRCAGSRRRSAATRSRRSSPTTRRSRTC